MAVTVICRVGHLHISAEAAHEKEIDRAGWEPGAPREEPTLGMGHLGPVRQPLLTQGRGIQARPAAARLMDFWAYTLGRGDACPCDEQCPPGPSLGSVDRMSLPTPLTAALSPGIPAGHGLSSF